MPMITSLKLGVATCALWLLSVSVCMGFDRGFEVIPLLGLQAGGTFQNEQNGKDLDIDEDICYGLAVDVDFNPDSYFEFLWMRQDTKIDNPANPNQDLKFSINYFHFGSTYSWYHTDKFRPYVIASIGATYFDPKKSSYDDELKFSMGVGIGLKYYITKHIGFMVEGRGFGTFMGGQTKIFCSSSHGCYITTSQDILIQFQSHAGLIFRF